MGQTGKAHDEQTFPLHPQLQTLLELAGMSLQCHFRTHAPQQQSVLIGVTSSASANSVRGTVNPRAFGRAEQASAWISTERDINGYPTE